jgi:hypothetical protein
MQRRVRSRSRAPVLPALGWGALKHLCPIVLRRRAAALVVCALVVVAGAAAVDPLAARTGVFVLIGEHLKHL